MKQYLNFQHIYSWGPRSREKRKLDMKEWIINSQFAERYKLQNQKTQWIPSVGVHKMSKHAIVKLLKTKGKKIFLKPENMTHYLYAKSDSNIFWFFIIKFESQKKIEQNNKVIKKKTVKPQFYIQQIYLSKIKLK